MKNLSKSDVTIDEGLRQAGSGLHHTKRVFLNANINTFKQCFAEYDRSAQSGLLQTLQPIWADSVDDTLEVKADKKQKKDMAYSIYGSHRPFINNHWENIKALNGGKVLICPLCGLNECTDMDHYIPSSIMHEYSFHLSNLIPLCHSCNLKKLDKWLDDAGRREIFNAYFDDEFQEPVIECSIRLSELDGQPEIHIEMNHSLQPNIPSHQIIISTMNRLQLLNEYRSIIQRDFCEELVKIYSYFELKSGEKSNCEIWEEQRELYHITLTHSDQLSFTTSCIYAAIVNSIVMEEWALNIDRF